MAHAFGPCRVSRELRVHVADGLVRDPHVGGNQAFEAPAVPVVLQVVPARRDDEPFLVDLARVHVQSGRPATDVDVMGDGGAEGNQLAFEEDRREDEHVGQVLPAVYGSLLM